MKSSSYHFRISSDLLYVLVYIKALSIYFFSTVIMTAYNAEATEQLKNIFARYFPAGDNSSSSTLCANIQRLVEDEGADPNVQQGYARMTLAQSICYYSNLLMEPNAIFHFSMRDLLESFRYLVSNDCDVERPDRMGKQLIHYAAQTIEPTFLKILLRENRVARANIDVKRIQCKLNVFGSDFTALHIVCFTERAPVQNAETLLQFHAHCDVRTAKEGQTPLHVAVVSTHSMEDTLALIKLLLAHGADLNAKDHSGNTPLHYAANSNELRNEVCTLLLEGGADIFAVNRDGETPLDVADDYSRPLLEEWALAGKQREAFAMVFNPRLSRVSPFRNMPHDLAPRVGKWMWPKSPPQV